jgi:hypothetical protein
MRLVKGIYVDSVEVTHPTSGEKVNLDIWLNPETWKLFALTNMEVDASRNYAYDPYQLDVGVLFENTFSGLPK